MESFVGLLPTTPCFAGYVYTQARGWVNARLSLHRGGQPKKLNKLKMYNSCNFFSVTAATTNKSVTFSEVKAGKLNECCKPISTRYPDTNGLASGHQSHVDRVPCVGSYEQHLFETPVSYQITNKILILKQPSNIRSILKLSEICSR